MSIWEIEEEDRSIEGLDADGKADPQYAAALGLIRAPYGRRALAAVIDLVGYALLQVPYWIFTLPLLLSVFAGRMSLYGFVNHPRFILAIVMASISLALSLAYCIVQLVLHGRKGTTIGKSITGIRSVNVKTLERPGFWRIVLRALILFGSAVVVIGPVLFLASPLLDPQKRGRGWHDMAGQTWMVDVRHGLQPYDAKKMRVARKTVTAEPVAKAKPMPSLATPATGTETSYRPGGRVSAGVLGVARPHEGGPRGGVGLSGLERPERPESGAAAPGKAALGAYRLRGADDDGEVHLPGSAASPAAAPAGEPGAGQPDLPSSADAVGPFGPGQPEPPTQADAVGPAVSGRADRSTPAEAYEPAAPNRPHFVGRPAARSTPPGQVAGAPSPSQAAALSGTTGPEAQAGTAEHGDVEATRLAPAHGTAPGTGAAQAEECVLHLDSGQRVPVTDVVVLGRNPSGEGNQPVAIADDTRSVSKTHLSIRAVDEGVEVTDRHSTNGTGIVRAGQEQVLSPGEPALAQPGDTIRFGERTARVERA